MRLVGRCPWRLEREFAGARKGHFSACTSARSWRTCCTYSSSDNTCSLRTTRLLLPIPFLHVLPRLVAPTHTIGAVLRVTQVNKIGLQALVRQAPRCRLSDKPIDESQHKLKDEPKVGHVPHYDGEYQHKCGLCNRDKRERYK